MLWLQVRAVSGAKMHVISWWDLPLTVILYSCRGHPSSCVGSTSSLIMWSCFLCSGTYRPMSVNESTGTDASNSDQHVYVDTSDDAADSCWCHHTTPCWPARLSNHSQCFTVQYFSCFVHTASSQHHSTIHIIVSSSDADTRQWYWTHQRLQTAQCIRWAPVCLPVDI